MNATHAKIALALAGILVWAYGYSTERAQVRWLGIGLLATAFVLRFIARRPPPAHGCQLTAGPAVEIGRASCRERV